MQIFMFVVIFGICGIILVSFISKVTQKHESKTNLINFKMLLNACFDDQFHALKLVEKEKQIDPSISDEVAAARALDKLLSKVRSKRSEQPVTSSKQSFTH
jgi:hypothetical protein